MNRQLESCGSLKPDITQEELKEILKYDKQTGNFTWRYTRSSRAVKGSIAGTLHPDGYIFIRLNGKNYSAHRLAYLYVRGKIPSQIDHRNTVKSDNRWENLRRCTNVQNRRNTGLYANNKSGVKGVSLDKRGKWIARASVFGVLKYLGSFDVKKDAKKAYQKFVKGLHGDFYCRT